MWNIPIADHSALTFCLFLKSCCFGTSADSRHNLRMRLVNDRDLGVLCVFLSPVLAFIENHGMFRLLECTSVDPTAGYLAIRQMMTVDWSASESVGLFPHARDSDVAHFREEHCTTVRGHGESTERFLPAVTVVG